ncbi:hypothetical protein [Solimicrobium silvestre]|uniref:Uncharacterized protein n=1 Tax=Solimicrobium silvestre TaxID=2099400 RepID=A0A2S9H0I6_9BURK|nr:hypothetical protein [Solimicrobium silvestre]PRC93460.1 hypothetical protein S2091_1847 [Solimicrobium silvestre]
MLNKLICFIFSSFLLLTLGVGNAQEIKDVEATYAISSKTIIDPAPGEKKDRVLLFLTGTGAKEIYDSILNPPKSSQCGPNLVVKSANNLECIKDTKTGTYQCRIGVMLDSGKTVKGGAC